MGNPPSKPHDLTVAGDFDFSLAGDHLKLHATDVTIDGLKIPAFTWQWIGLSIAQGVLAAFGGALFGALAQSFLGGGSHQSLEETLAKQFQAFAGLMQELISHNEIRAATGELLGYLRNFQNYHNDPTPERLISIIDGNSIALSKMKTLGGPGYRIYMIASGLQLSALQERIKQHHTKGTVENFIDQRDDSIAHHNEIIDYIDSQTEIQPYLPKVVPRINIIPHIVTIKRNLMDIPIDWRFTLGTHEVPTASMWQELRASVKAANTDLGEKMIVRWKGVKY